MQSSQTSGVVGKDDDEKSLAVEATEYVAFVLGRVVAVRTLGWIFERPFPAGAQSE